MIPLQLERFGTFLQQQHFSVEMGSEISIIFVKSFPVFRKFLFAHFQKKKNVFRKNKSCTHRWRRELRLASAVSPSCRAREREREHWAKGPTDKKTSISSKQRAARTPHPTPPRLPLGLPIDTPRSRGGAGQRVTPETHRRFAKGRCARPRCRRSRPGSRAPPLCPRDSMTHQSPLASCCPPGRRRTPGCGASCRSPPRCSRRRSCRARSPS